jgi:hypothetical protein
MRAQCRPTERPGRDREPAAVKNPQVDGGRTGIRTQGCPASGFQDRFRRVRYQQRQAHRAIGEWFQQRYKHPTVGADTDPGVRRRVRWTGLLLVVFGAGCVAAGALVWG